MEAERVVLVGDSLAADRVLKAVGCQRCQQRRASTTGRVFAPCQACTHLPAWSPGQTEKLPNEAGSHILSVLDKHGWCFTIKELAKYLTEKTRAPWLRIDWGDTFPRLAKAGATIAQTRAATNGFGREQRAAPWVKESYHAPYWLQVLLDIGTVMRKGGFNATVHQEGFDWPRVINHFTEFPDERAPLMSVISCATTTQGVQPAAFGFPEHTIEVVDPKPIAAFLAEGWPDLLDFAEPPNRGARPVGRRR